MASKKKDREESNYVKWLCYRSSGFSLGSDKEFVWLAPENKEDPRAYYQAELVSKDEKTFTAKDEKGNLKKAPNDEKNFFGVNPAKFDGVEDMAELGHLSEPAVLHNMKKRYDVDLFHTYSGLFLVIVNPYKRLPIYTDEMIKVYTGRRRDQVAPHVFALADTAYRAMLQDRKDQSMLITGESGAGKTENTKKVIQYLAGIAGRAQEGGTLEQQLLEFNPVLESFGNAKTNKNNNSSRFGKFIELQFNSGGQIAGANTMIYLLEKSRVVFQGKNERNFHVFYQLIAGASPEEKAKLHLTRCEDYAYLNQSGCTTVKYMDDAKEFEHCCRAFDILNVSEEERWGIWEVIASILHLGNLPFDSKGDTSTDLKNETELKVVAELLGVAPSELKEGLLRPKIEVGGGERVVKGLNLQKVQASRDALVKGLYGRLFIWIVNKINEVLSHPEKKSLFIGVLDISGFEIFVKNSFEQLCINYTNEKLQQFFNHHMFTLEQKEYEAEGIKWDFIDFGLDLQDTIDLIEKPPNGILTILDEQTNFPDATDTTFTRRLHRTNGAHRSFRKPRFEADNFKILHYAGEVEYDTIEWLEKNRDPIEPDLVRIMKTSRHALMQVLWQEGLMPTMGRVQAADNEASKKAGLTGKAQKSTMWITVGLQYKQQLDHLMTTLRSTDPHFIRCIIPNLEQRPGIINEHLVLDQLKCNGVLEGIRITRKGFPNRVKYAQFLKRYHLLKHGLNSTAPNAKLAVQELLNHLFKNNADVVKEELVRYGHTKIFFKTGQLPAIERLREQLISSMIVSIQCAVRAYLARRLYDKLREQTVAARVLQRNLRAWMDLKDWGWWRIFVKGRPILEDIDVQQEINTLKARVKELEKQVADLEKENEVLASTKKKLTEEISKMDKDIQELEDEAENLRSEKKNLENERKVLEKKAESLQEELDDEIAVSKQLEGEKKALNGKVLELENKVDDLENKIKDAELEKQKLTTDRDSWKDKYNSLDQVNDQLKKKIEEKEKEVMDLEEKQFDAKGIGELLKKKLQTAEQNATLLATQLSAEADKVRDLDGKNKKLNGDLERVTKQAADLTEEKNNITENLRKVNSELTNTKQELNTEKVKAEKLEKQQAGLKQRLKEIQDSVEEQMEAQSSAERQKKLLVDKLDEANDSIKDLKDEKLSLEKRIDAYKAEVGDMQLAVEDGEAAAKRWENEAKSRSKDIEELTNELENERENSRKLKLGSASKIKELELQVSMGGPGGGATVGELKALQEELNRVRQELSDARDAKVVAERSLQAVANERDDFKAQLEQAEGRASRFMKDARRLQAELDESSTSGSTAKAAREILQKKNDEYLKELQDLKNQLVSAQIKGGANMDVNSLQKENNTLKEEVASMNRKLRMQDLEFRNLKPQIDDLTYQLEQEKISSAKVTLQLKDKDKMLMERELANARLVQGLTDSHVNEKKELLAEIADMKLKNSELQSKCNQLNDDFEEMISRFQRQGRRPGGEGS